MSTAGDTLRGPPQPLPQGCQRLDLSHTGLTVICFSGMKSALCLTRSKILARWGLMKASSGRQQSIQRAEG